MTILIGMCFGHCSVVIADKQESLMRNGSVIESHNKADKIVSIPIGLVTGSGAVSLLQPVKTALADTAITHTNDILSIIKSERHKYNQNGCISQEIRSNDLCTTGWIISYSTPENDQIAVRSVLYHPSLSEDHFIQIRKNTSQIVYPSGMTEDQQSECLELLPRNLEELYSEFSLENIIKSILRAVQVVQLASEYSDTVSKECDISFYNHDQKLLANNISLENFKELRFNEI